MRVLRQLASGTDPVSWEGAFSALAPGTNGSPRLGRVPSGVSYHDSVAEPPPDPGPDLEAARQQGYGQGFDAGIAQGRSQAEAEVGSHWQARFQEESAYHRALVEQMSAALQEELEAFHAAVDEALPEVIIEIARKVVDAEVTTNPAVVRAALSQAVRRLKGPALTVRHNPADLPWLAEELERMNGEGDDRQVTIQVVADEEVARGGVIAQTDQGVVDARIQTKFELLKAEVC